MPTATVDGLEVNYEIYGSGRPLLMMAPGGFDATIDKWTNTSAWKGLNVFERLASQFQLIAYDRRETGKSGGRVEKLTWDLYARQAKGLLEHLKISSAFVLGGCMGCSVALAFGVRYPESTRALLLHWPVGGHRWKANSRKRFARHAAFVQEKGIAGVLERARETKSFWQDPESGPWAPVIGRDEKFAEAFKSQDQERYMGIVETSGATLYDRDTAPGAEPEEAMGVKAPALVIPGDDPSHATSAAHYLRECLPNATFWNVMPPEQNTARVCDLIVDYCRDK